MIKIAYKSNSRLNYLAEYKSSLGFFTRIIKLFQIFVVRPQTQTLDTLYLLQKKCYLQVFSSVKEKVRVFSDKLPPGMFSRFALIPTGKHSPSIALVSFFSFIYYQFE